MVYSELKHFVWYMVNFEEIQWYIMNYPSIKYNDYYERKKHPMIIIRLKS